MRRITLWLSSTVAIVVLLFSYRTSTMGSGSTDTTAVQSGSGSNTYDGSVAQTRWGAVQVRITVATGKITDVEAIQYPTENHRDEEINSYALPILHDAVISKQSANIDAVSGATVTSEGYIQSLQAAIDSAHLS
jgi:uncharacterized protein with FMN-binding domain